MIKYGMIKYGIPYLLCCGAIAGIVVCGVYLQNKYDREIFIWGTIRNATCSSYGCCYSCDLIIDYTFNNISRNGTLNDVDYYNLPLNGAAIKIVVDEHGNIMQSYIRWPPIAFYLIAGLLFLCMCVMCISSCYSKITKQKIYILGEHEPLLSH